MLYLRKILHIISAVSSYVSIFMILFLVQKYTIGLIPGVKNVIVFHKFYLYEIVFSLVAIWFIKRYITIYTPYKK